MYNLLPIHVLKKVEILEGKTFDELRAIFPNEERDKILNNTNNKGRFGQWAEWLLNDVRGDNLAEADFGDIEFKFVNAKFHNKSGKWAPKDQVAITRINFNKIQETNFKDSCIIKKSKILYVLYAKDIVDIWKSKIVRLGFIDYNEYTVQMEEDYEFVRQLTLVGKADTIKSGNNGGAVKVIKPRPQGSAANNSDNYVVNGKTLSAKKKGFYIDQAWIRENLK